MPVEIHPLPAFEDNYIWALQSGAAVAVVDPGDAAPVMRYLEETGGHLAAILITHKHGDHTGGIAELVARWPVPVFGPATEDIPHCRHQLRGGEHINVPELGIDFEVIAVPGHTLGHVVYYRRGMLFCGDTLFGGGCGRVFEGTMTQMQSSLARLADLPPDTAVYCAHEYTQSNLRFAHAVEPNNAALQARRESVAKRRAAHLPTVPSLLADELATNPFLRWSSPDVIAAATTHAGKTPRDAVETFTAIREWKNGFR